MNGATAHTGERVCACTHLSVLEFVLYRRTVLYSPVVTVEGTRRGAGPGAGGVQWGPHWRALNEVGTPCSRIAISTVGATNQIWEEREKRAMYKAVGI